MLKTKELRPLKWNSEKSQVEVIDQRLLPNEHKWIEVKNCREMAFAIKDMIIRGAPLIGIGAAFAMAMAARDNEDLDEADKLLRATRPTAVNLMWALDEAKKVIYEYGLSKASCEKTDNEVLFKKLLEKAVWILEDDIERCKEMSRVGAEYIKENVMPSLRQRACEAGSNPNTENGLLRHDVPRNDDDANEGERNEVNRGQGLRILTHCNAGALATGGYGTALGVIRKLHEEGLVEMVYSDETRPRQQGSKLTAWELAHDGIPVTMISDNMAAHCMQHNMIDLVVVGSDRITANGDAANKIGTYQVAIVAKHHNVPFFVAAPHSTIDMSLASGGLIPIEERDASELHTINGKLVTASEGVEFFNPGFDVTPRELIEAIFTEKGLF